MSFLDSSLLLPGFVREGLVSAPLVWGKLPSRGDYIRHNVKHDQAERVQDWIRAQLRVAKAMDLTATLQDTSQPATSAVPVAKQKAHKRDGQAGFWHSLSPEPAASARIVAMSSTAQAPTPAVIAQTALPWCFVLPPDTLAFARKQHVIGVWMDSSDKIGRRYPLVMMQTASPRWIKQYFSNHAAQPCDWLYFAARCIAQAVYAEETEQDRPHPNAPDHAATLVSQLTRLWALYQPGWRETLGRGTQIVDAQAAQAIVGAPHPEDVVRTLDGVRYLPWADWPQRLLGEAPLTAAQPAFWQQDLQGRFVGAGQVLHAGL